MNEAKQTRNKYREAKAYNSLGFVHHSLNDYEKAIEFYQQSLTMVKEIGDKDSEGKAYTSIGSAYACLGDYKKSNRISSAVS